MTLIEEADKKEYDELSIGTWDQAKRYTISGVGTMKELVDLLKTTNKTITVAIVPGRRLIEEIKSNNNIGCKAVKVITEAGSTLLRMAIWYEDGGNFDNFDNFDTIQFFK